MSTQRLWQCGSDSCTRQPRANVRAAEFTSTVCELKISEWTLPVYTQWTDQYVRTGQQPITYEANKARDGRFSPTRSEDNTDNTLLEICAQPASLQHGCNQYAQASTTTNCRQQAMQGVSDGTRMVTVFEDTECTHSCTAARKLVTDGVTGMKPRTGNNDLIIRY